MKKHFPLILLIILIAISIGILIWCFVSPWNDRFGPALCGNDIGAALFFFVCRTLFVIFAYIIVVNKPWRKQSLRSEQEKLVLLSLEQKTLAKRQLLLNFFLLLKYLFLVILLISVVVLINVLPKVVIDPEKFNILLGSTLLAVVSGIFYLLIRHKEAQYINDRNRDGK